MDDRVRREVEVAAQILKQAGACEVYLFGSAAAGKVHAKSDLDLAVRGLPPERFFPAMSEVTFALKREIDLVDLDEPSPFTEYLVRKGKLSRVG